MNCLCQDDKFFIGLGRNPAETPLSPLYRFPRSAHNTRFIIAARFRHLQYVSFRAGLHKCQWRAPPTHSSLLVSATKSWIIQREDNRGDEIVERKQ
jgi:hypothetical protein